MDMLVLVYSATGILLLAELLFCSPYTAVPKD